MPTDDFIPSEEELRANSEAHNKPHSLWSPLPNTEPSTTPEDKLVLDNFSPADSVEDVYGVSPQTPAQTSGATSENPAQEQLEPEQPALSDVAMPVTHAHEIAESDSYDPLLDDTVHTSEPAPVETGNTETQPQDATLGDAVETHTSATQTPEAHTEKGVFETDSAHENTPTELPEQATDPSVTTTIPAMNAQDISDYVPSTHVPEDILEARESDNPPTTAIRRGLMSIHEEETPQAPTWESAVVPPASVAPVVPAQPSGQTPDSLSDTIFEGTTVVPVVPSRAQAHIASLFLGLLLIPAGWYLYADASARMLFPADAPVTTGHVSWLALAEFGGAFVVWLLFLLLTLRSSLGAWVWGVVVTVAGIPWLVVPGVMMTHTERAFEWLKHTGGVVGSNLAHHVQLSAFSGRFFLMGLVLVSMAIIAMVARRRGRAEEALRAQVEKVNPEGAFLSRRARRQAQKQARRSL